MTDRTIPNPDSKLLRHAIIGGAGLCLPPGELTAPQGMAMVILLVPLKQLTGMSPPDIQQDLGLPWSGSQGEPRWFDGL